MARGLGPVSAASRQWIMPEMIERPRPRQRDYYSKQHNARAVTAWSSGLEALLALISAVPIGFDSR
jgi:hypothetical protein